jgi:hypothetical protein
MVNETEMTGTKTEEPIAVATPYLAGSQPSGELQKETNMSC